MLRILRLFRIRVFVHAGKCPNFRFECLDTGVKVQTPYYGVWNHASFYVHTKARGKCSNEPAHAPEFGGVQATRRRAHPWHMQRNKSEIRTVVGASTHDESTTCLAHVLCTCIHIYIYICIYVYENALHHIFWENGERSSQTHSRACVGPIPSILWMVFGRAVLPNSAWERLRCV